MKKKKEENKSPESLLQQTLNDILACLRELALIQKRRFEYESGSTFNSKEG